MGSPSLESWYPGREAAGIYLHIPFCRKACVYCNFHFSTSPGLKDAVLEAMVRELVQRKDYLAGLTVRTLYFGGGTPSLLQAGEINRFFDTIYRHYPHLDLAECTLEANPDDMSNGWLRDLRQTPINRLSIGVQSFRDSDLLYMKRAHNARQAEYAIKAAQDAGYTNLNIDLIYGTPGPDNQAWQRNLEKFTEFDIPHLSAYALTVEEKTALHYSIQHKKSAPVDPDLAADQFGMLMSWARGAGFHHYEISNLAKPGSYAVHNTCYWMGNRYLGIGPSAHSYNGKARRWNIAHNALYAGGETGGKELFEEEYLNPEQQYNEYVMTSLRTMWGLDLHLVRGMNGGEFVAGLTAKSQKYLQSGWLQQEDGHLRLTDQGRLFADQVAAALFS